MRRFDTGPLQRQRAASDAHLDSRRDDPIPVRGASRRHSTPLSGWTVPAVGAATRWWIRTIARLRSDGFCLACFCTLSRADLARLATRPSSRRLRSSVSARQLFSARKCTHATTWAVKATLGVQCEARQGARDQKMAKDCGQGSALVIFCASSRARLDMARDGRGRRASRPALV